MLNNLLFSAQKAQELNELAKKIDSRLLLFCGYKPMEQFTHPQAGFILGCLNLYKCTVDSMILWRKFGSYHYKTYLPANGETILAEVDLMQEILRSTLAHNNSEINGDFQTQRINAYENWVKKITGSPMLETEESYTLVLKALLDMGDQLFRTLEYFLKQIARASDHKKAVIINSWIQDAANWYSGKKYHEIYLGWLNQNIRSRFSANENLPTTRRILIRNALKKQADEDFFNIVGYRTDLERMQQFVNNAKKQGPHAAKAQILKEAADAEINREKEYDRIDLLGWEYDKKKKTMVERPNNKDLELAWQYNLKNQLVERAEKVDSLSPDVWLDDHIYTYITRLDATPVNYKPFIWRKLPGERA